MRIWSVLLEYLRRKLPLVVNNVTLEQIMSHMYGDWETVMLVTYFTIDGQLKPYKISKQLMDKSGGILKISSTSPKPSTHYYMFFYATIFLAGIMNAPVVERHGVSAERYNHLALVLHDLISTPCSP
jgi:hypothetical protein